MKILFLSTYPLGEAITGGVEAACVYLAEALTVMGHSVEVISVKTGLTTPRRELKRNVTVHHVPCAHHLPLIGPHFQAERLTLFYRDTRFLYNYIRSECKPLPDIIHGQGLSKEGYLAVKIAQTLRIPSIITIHGMVDIETERYWGGKVRAHIVRFIMRRTLASAGGLIFTAPYRQQELQAHNSGHSFLIENPIAEGFFGIQGGQEPWTVLFPGTLIRRKRVLDLIHAFRRVIDYVPNACLRIAGSSQGSRYEKDYIERVLAAIQQLNLQDKVIFCGRLDRASMLEEYRKARVVVLASELETAPLALSEAMAAGVPVVATHVGGTPWMVNDGENGYLVDVGDIEGIAERIIELLLNRAHWEAFSIKAKQAAERFRASRVAALTLEAYYKVLGRGM